MGLFVQSGLLQFNAFLHKIQGCQSVFDCLQKNDLQASNVFMCCHFSLHIFCNSILLTSNLVFMVDVSMFSFHFVLLLLDHDTNSIIRMFIVCLNLQVFRFIRCQFDMENKCSPFLQLTRGQTTSALFCCELFVLSNFFCNDGPFQESSETDWNITDQCMPMCSHSQMLPTEKRHMCSKFVGGTDRLKQTNFMCQTSLNQKKMS